MPANGEDMPPTWTRHGPGGAVSRGAGPSASQKSVKAVGAKKGGVNPLLAMAMIVIVLIVGVYGSPKINQSFPLPFYTDPSAPKIAEWRKRRAMPRASNTWTLGSGSRCIDTGMTPVCSEQEACYAAHSAPP